MTDANKKYWGTRYYFQTEYGFTLCCDTIEELKYNYMEELKKNNKGETVKVIKQDMYTNENIDTVIEIFTV